MPGGRPVSVSGLSPHDLMAGSTIAENFGTL